MFDFKLKKIRPLRATLVELGVDPTEQVSIVLAPYDKSQSRSANERYNKLHTSSNSELNSLNLDVLNFQSSIGNSMAVCDTKGSTVAVSNSSNGRQNSSDKCDAESLIDEKSSVASFYAKRHRKSTFETARIALQVDSYLNPEAAFSKPVTTNSFVSSPYSCIENFIVGCDENDDDSTSSDSQSNISRVAATISSSSTSVANPRNDTGTCKNKCQNEQINLKSAPSQSTNDKESTMNGSKTTENDRRKSNSFFQSLEGSDLPSRNKYSKKKSHQEGKCDNVRSENQHNKGKRRQDYCGDDISMNRGDHTGSSSSSGFQSHRSYSFHEKGLEGQYENKKNANCWSKRNSTYHTYLSKEGKYETRKDYHCSKLFSKDVPESINDISASNYIESKNISWTLDRKGSKTNSTEYSEQDLSYMGSSSCNRK